MAAINTKPIKKNIDRDAMVEVKNITNGTLTWKSNKTGAEFVLEGFGATDWVEVSELITLKNTSPTIINEPWLMIDDNAVVEFLGLKTLYSKILSFEDLVNLFSKPIKEIEKILNIAPNGIKSVIASRAKEMVDKEELNDLKVIKLIERMLNVALLPI